jgi:hypothetical protein
MAELYPPLPSVSILPLQSAAGNQISNPTREPYWRDHTDPAERRKADDLGAAGPSWMAAVFHDLCEPASVDDAYPVRQQQKFR